MLPTEQFSGDATEDKTPWTPQVWRDGPDVLVQDAQLALYQTRADVEVDALGGRRTAPSMDGSVNQGANEQELTVNPGTPPEGSGGRAAQWQFTLMQLRSTNMLAGNVMPSDYDPPAGDANPSA